MPGANLLQRRRTRRLPGPHKAANPIRDPLDVSNKDPRVTNVRRGLTVGFEFCPTGETLLSCNDKLSIMQAHILPHTSVVHVSPAKMPVSQPGECFPLSRTHTPQQFPSLFFLLF
jgi:hypothetical protein